MKSSASWMLRSAKPMGGGVMPNAISMASDEATECTPPHTPHTRLEMNLAALGVRREEARTLGAAALAHQSQTLLRQALIVLAVERLGGSHPAAAVLLDPLLPARQLGAEVLQLVIEVLGHAVGQARTLVLE